MKIVILFGLKRSGNHYILSNIIQNYDNHVHLNDIDLSYSKFNSFRDIEVTNRRIDRMYTGFKNVDCIILSCEGKINFGEVTKFLTNKSEEDEVYPILLIRNPYNNMSSLKKKFPNMKVMQSKIRLWQIYAKFFISDESNEFIKIVYDHFCTDPEYFNKKLGEIDVNTANIDNNFRISFQQSSFQNESQSQRYYGNLDTCVYANDKSFVKLFDKTDIEELWDKIQ